jgi:hypothetical protein
MFLSAVTLISGRQTKTEFAVAARNLNSQLQDWINDAQTGYPGGKVGQYTCTVAGSKLKIDNTPSSTSPSCIFLGKAIQVTDASFGAPQDSRIIAYAVFGARSDSSGDLVTTMADALPTAAIGKNGGHGGTADLTAEYDLPADITVQKVISSGGTSHLAGFYSTLNNEQSTGSNGNTDLVAYQYPLGNEAEKNNKVFQCINNNPPCPLPLGKTNPPRLQNWQICLSNGQDYAVITISSADDLNVTSKLAITTACP